VNTKINLGKHLKVVGEWHMVWIFSVKISSRIASKYMRMDILLGQQKGWKLPNNKEALKRRILDKCAQVT
jgi:hypothetical protein